MINHAPECHRPASVQCLGTEEAEAVDSTFGSAFRRPPTVARFRTVSGKGSLHHIVHMQNERVVIHTPPMHI